MHFVNIKNKKGDLIYGNVLVRFFFQHDSVSLDTFLKSTLFCGMRTVMSVFPGHYLLCYVAVHSSLSLNVIVIITIIIYF